MSPHTTTHYSSCFWWVTPSSTEEEQIVLAYSSWHSWRTMPLVPIANNTSWGGGGKNLFCFRAGRGAVAIGVSLMQSEKMDLQSCRVGGCWRCSTWSLLSPLWQRTGLDHWRWWGDLKHGDVRGSPQENVRAETYMGTGLNKSTIQINVYSKNLNDTHCYPDTLHGCLRAQWMGSTETSGCSGHHGCRLVTGVEDSACLGQCALI